ncbi:hypothetical protein CEXT_296951, partial [Caerostris extrusa]
ERIKECAKSGEIDPASVPQQLMLAELWKSNADPHRGSLFLCEEGVGKKNDELHGLVMSGAGFPSEPMSLLKPMRRSSPL